MRIGVYGGRFDPPHLGHLLLAETAREALALDQVWFVPAAAPPHKPVVAPAGARAAMTALAVRDHPAFAVSHVELQRDGPSYGVATLERLRAAFPATHFAYLLGEDAFRELGSWHRAPELVHLAQLAVVTRPGADADDAPEPFRSAATRVEGVPFDVSSTALRRRLRQGRSVRYLMPAAVTAYATRFQLYAPAKGGPP